MGFKLAFKGLTDNCGASQCEMSALTVWTFIVMRATVVASAAASKALTLCQSGGHSEDTQASVVRPLNAVTYI